MDSSARHLRSRPQRRGLLLAAGWISVLVCTGCSDKRISMQELLNRQAALASSVEVEAVKPPELKLTEFQRYRIQNGDVLNLTMTGVAQEQAAVYQPVAIRVRVDADGHVTLPLAGRVKLAGLDFAAAENAIVAAHKEIITQPFSVYVELLGPENTTVIVTGGADLPGLVTLPQNERNMLYALARSGGFGPNSAGIIHYKPIAPDRERETFDVTNMNDVRRMLLAPPLQSGDVLEVEALDANVVYITGLTNVPGAISIPRNKSISLLRAISAAGGLREYLKVKDATLIRRLADGEQVRAKVDLAAIYDGEAPDIALAAGDILQIPHTAETRFQEWVNTNVLNQFSVGVRYDPLQQYNTNRLLQRQDSLRGNALQDSVLINLSNLLIPQPVAQ